jgi:hypothetical protein
MRNKVFISYSHDDERWRKRLSLHLSVLVQQKLVELWDDAKISPGTPWLAEINEQMRSARVALLLISPSFLTSEFILRHEVPTLFERHEASGTTIYPLLVRQCAWREVAWLSRLQMRPQAAKPVASFRGSRIDEILTDVALELAQIVRSEMAPAVKRSPDKLNPHTEHMASTAASATTVPAGSGKSIAAPAEKEVPGLSRTINNPARSGSRYV